MGLGDLGPSRQRSTRRLLGVPGRAGLWSPASPPTSSDNFGGDLSTHVQDPNPPASGRLEDLGRRLVRAFQRAVASGASRRAREASAAAAAAAAAAREERSRAREEGSGARVQCALAKLRAELLDMRFQSHQLTRTLLELNVKMLQLQEEHELETPAEPQGPKDDPENLEHGDLESES
ncbi:alanine and arginine-rich domain-containing protein [Perognathus longimembris pacificus]|uniref:alanine and arginine-rich domain-containing protein n=1 Tax=Perognathus longimembris pacificus TaxID=214514 RepID=UPI00201849DA|nr:alanine and arginine-rich domain-containing protein [Perognathus longimembris pacificus]